MIKSFSDKADCLLQPQLDFMLIELFHALENEIAIVFGKTPHSTFLEGSQGSYVNFGRQFWVQNGSKFSCSRISAQTGLNYRIFKGGL